MKASDYSHIHDPTGYIAMNLIRTSITDKRMLQGHVHHTLDGLRHILLDRKSVTVDEDTGCRSSLPFRACGWNTKTRKMSISEVYLRSERNQQGDSYPTSPEVAENG